MGSFSLNAKQAEDKLRHSRLGQPELYVLNLVACAVSFGATCIEFRGDADDLRCIMKGVYLEEPTVLENLSSFASEEHSRPLFELAVALEGARRLEPRRATLHFSSKTSGAQLTLENGEYRYEALPGDDEETSLTFTIRERLSLRTGQKFLARLTQSEAANSETEILSRHCNRCPIPIFYNGRSVVRPIISRGASKLRFFSEHDVAPPSHLFPNGVPPTVGSFAPECWGVLGVGGQLPPWLTLVVNGVSFRIPEVTLQGTKIRGFVFTNHLKKDLSQTRLVQDREYDAVLKGIERALALK